MRKRAMSTFFSLNEFFLRANSLSTLKKKKKKKFIYLYEAPTDIHPLFNFIVVCKLSSCLLSVCH